MIADKLFGPMDFSRRDLASLNIMRGRDNGLPDYNTVRAAFGLPKLNWSQINPQLLQSNPEIFQDLYNLYGGNENNIDLYVGGMLESITSEGRPGQVFRKIIKEQFERIRNADRFWFENESNGIFTREEIEEIRKIRLWDILVNTTSIPPEAIQRDVFQFRLGDPCPQPGQLNSSQLEPCIILKGWDYFHGSELPYIMVCLLLIFMPITITMAAYGVVKMQNRRRRKLKAKRERSPNEEYDKLCK